MQARVRERLARKDSSAAGKPSMASSQELERQLREAATKGNETAMVALIAKSVDIEAKNGVCCECRAE